MSSPEDAITGLRRRAKSSPSKERPTSHSKKPSDGFGSFVDASDTFTDFDNDAANQPSASAHTFDPGLAEPFESSNDNPFSLDSSAALIPIHQANEPKENPGEGHGEESDEWADADLVQKFSPVSDRGFGSASTKPNPATKKTSISESTSWPDWDSFLASHSVEIPPTNPTSSLSGRAPLQTSAHPPSHLASFNPADEAFFEAFENASKQQQQRVPSPPIIDLREVERKLKLKRSAANDAAGNGNSDHAGEDSHSSQDFFTAFEKAPQRALGRSSTLVLEPSQLEDIHDARTSPMTLPNDLDYFDPMPAPTQGSAKPQPIHSKSQDHKSLNPQQQHDHYHDAPCQEASSPSSWTGSLRKTWSSLRGLPGDLVNHLPSASDFIVPPDENEERATSHDTNPGGGLLIVSDAKRSASPVSDHLHRASIGSRSSSGSSGTVGTTLHSGPLRAKDLLATSPKPSPITTTLRRGTSQTSSGPISGAPGFNASSTRKWNTGDWTLDPKENKRAIPVTLFGRSEETESVCESWHAARIQAVLPPRLQLGRKWKLLYSLDQHGISLHTLYHRVAQGLDPSLIRKAGSGGVADAEGWLRGASNETKSALGLTSCSCSPSSSSSLSSSSGGLNRERANSRVKRVGGGISSISDAGLVIAIKDEQDNVFGAFVNEKLRPQQHYYGSGECFLWKTVEKKRKPSSERSLSDEPHRHHHGLKQDDNNEKESENDTKTLETFRWTGKNDYMVLTESNFLSVGGGNGRFGLWIDGALERGVSSKCPAFDNEILCNSRDHSHDSSAIPKEGSDTMEEARFECIGLEVWAVGMD